MLSKGVKVCKCKSSVNKTKSSKRKLVIVSTFGPGMERSSDGRENFWIKLNDCLANIDRHERMIVLGELNYRIGDRENDVVASTVQCA